MAKPGPMRMRARLVGDYADIKVLMSHPMANGRQKNRKTGKLIPAHFITNINATLNGKSVLTVECNQSISKNPFFGFKVNGAKTGDKVTIDWLDNEGERDSITGTVS